LGLFSKYYPKDSDAADEQTPEPEIMIDEGLGPLWPPSPKVQILLIGLGIFLLNLVLLVVFAIVLWQNG
jgi:hypothetical protein